jgi:hypothetical protein
VSVIAYQQQGTKELQSGRSNQITEAIPSHSAISGETSPPVSPTDRHQKIPKLFLIRHGGVEIAGSSLGVPWPNESEDSIEKPAHRQRRERGGQIGSCFVKGAGSVWVCGRFLLMAFSASTS